MSTNIRRTETAAFPATEASVSEARRWLSKILDGHPRHDDAVLLLSEAVTNSVVHTVSSAIGVTVTIEENDTVRIEVTDEGARTVPSVPPSPDEELASCGRGILLIRALSSRWGFTEENPRCAVWFALSTRAGAGSSGAALSTSPMIACPPGNP